MSIRNQIAGRPRLGSREPRRTITAGGYEVALWPAAGYDVRYTPNTTVFGFAFEAQDGTHAFASDRKRPFRARPNSSAYIPAGCEVTSCSATGGEYLTITTTNAGEVSRLPARHFNDHIDWQAIIAAQTLRRIVLSEACFDILELEREILRFCDTVHQANGVPYLTGAERWMTARRLKHVDEIIEAGLSNRITVGALAGSLGLSAGFFNRAFKAGVGKTPHDYILDRRISRARRLIGGTETDLARVAAACGFASQAHMTTQMRQRLGVTPGTLRSRA